LLRPRFAGAFFISEQSPVGAPGGAAHRRARKVRERWTRYNDGVDPHCSGLAPEPERFFGAQLDLASTAVGLDVFACDSLITAAPQI